MSMTCAVERRKLQIVRRGRERIYDSNSIEPLPVLEILTEEASAATVLSGGDDQGIPPRDMSLVRPIPRALEQRLVRFYRIPGEKLLDGSIKSISPQGLIIVQDISDPLSLVKQREIRKSLRAFEDAPQ